MSAQPPADYRPTPNNYMAWSIISLVVSLMTCCLCYTLPTIAVATVALVFSIKVNNAKNAGDHDGAEQASKNAKLWNMIAAGVFAAGLLLWVAMFFSQGGMEGQRERMEQIQKLLEQRGH